MELGVVTQLLLTLPQEGSAEPTSGRSVIALFTGFGTSARVNSSCFNFLWDRM